jgi:hypothetical protein
VGGDKLVKGDNASDLYNRKVSGSNHGKLLLHNLRIK